MGVFRWIRLGFASALYPALLFGAAGTVGWAAGWIFLATLYGFGLVLWRVLARDDPNLLQERLKSPFQKEQKPWDKVFMAVFMLAYLAWLPVAGLDAVRFGWSRVPVAWQAAGGLAYACSLVLMYPTFRANPFLFSVVKIEKEQSVVTTGPYARVRHPLYSSVLILFPGASLLLGSLYAAAISGVMCLLIVVRTVLEDRTLHEELEGYAEYAAQVRSRLIPGVW